MPLKNSQFTFKYLKFNQTRQEGLLFAKFTSQKANT